MAPVRVVVRETRRLFPTVGFWDLQSDDNMRKVLSNLLPADVRDLPGVLEATLRAADVDSRLLRSMPSATVVGTAIWVLAQEDNVVEAGSFWRAHSADAQNGVTVRATTDGELPELLLRASWFQ